MKTKTLKAYLSILVAFSLALSSCDKKNACLVNRRTTTLKRIEKIKEEQRTKTEERTRQPEEPRPAQGDGVPLPSILDGDVAVLPPPRSELDNVVVAVPPSQPADGSTRSAGGVAGVLIKQLPQLPPLRITQHNLGTLKLYTDGESYCKYKIGNSHIYLHSPVINLVVLMVGGSQMTISINYKTIYSIYSSIRASVCISTRLTRLLLLIYIRRKKMNVLGSCISKGQGQAPDTMNGFWIHVYVFRVQAQAFRVQAVQVQVHRARQARFRHFHLQAVQARFQAQARVVRVHFQVHRHLLHLRAVQAQAVRVHLQVQIA